ncbi:membrane protein [Agarivorans sp. Toyoura001]|uniref:lysine exporter LysO family protein n=1 Tax=Agarivorans sp. Toyoura001 TaxID=2283141 RepID=UPI0010EE2352|nr:lysine exporter LysO family protein [Agarivorans sp. Toyoura001]GDY26871.1 membrane protein [Agarivorans sp. Toyoura001]
MYSSLLMILGALIVGYVIPVKHPAILASVRRLSSWMLYLILFLMGYGLAFIENLGQNIVQLFSQAATLVGLLLVFNLSALFFVGRYLAMPKAEPQHRKSNSKLAMFKEPLVLIALLVVGLLAGISYQQTLPAQSVLAEYALIILIFCIGIELRSAGISLRQLVLNRRGLIIALVVVASSLPAGAITAYLFELPINIGLAMSSGFGWYSLSGALLSKATTPLIGSTAFFADLSRELITLLLIPSLMQRSPAATIGYAGATAMDFSLPMLQRAGGNQLVPAAIASGFILSLLCPVMILLLVNLA